jgi:hypothetical protein
LEVTLDIKVLDGERLDFGRVTHRVQPLLDILGGEEFLMGARFPVPQFLHQLLNKVEHSL